jgi:hypothetical protein
MHVTETICKFVNHDPELESLYLMLRVPFDWTSLACTISSSHYLKALVMRHLVDRGGQYLINSGIPWRSQLGQVLQEDYLLWIFHATWIVSMY